MSTCATILASRASQYPALLPRKAAAETERVEHDISQDVDCEGIGITIVNSTWVIDTDDDDGMLTLGVASFDAAALLTRQPVSGGTEGASYRLHNTVTTSDGLVLTYTSQLPIAPTVKIAFGV